MLGGVFLPGDSLFTGVSQVRARVRSCASRTGDVRPIRVLGPALSRDEDAPGPACRTRDAAVVEEFTQRFDEAVRLRLHGDVEVAVYLSGGVDSAMVVRAMADGGRSARSRWDCERRLRRNGRGDHGRRQRPASSRRSRRSVRAISPNRSSTRSGTPRRRSSTRTLPRSSSCPSWPAAHVKVVLTGEGADELLGGLPAVPPSAAARRLRRDPRDRAHAATSSRRSSPARATFGGTVPITQLSRRRGRGAAIRRLSLPAAKVIVLPAPAVGAAGDAAPPAIAGLRLARRARGADRSHRARRAAAGRCVTGVLFKTELPGYILSSLGDRMEMAHSVEGRMPFLDHELVEFVSRLPLRFKLRDRWTSGCCARPSGSACRPRRRRQARVHGTVALDAGARGAARRARRLVRSRPDRGRPASSTRRRWRLRSARGGAAPGRTRRRRCAKRRW